MKRKITSLAMLFVIMFSFVPNLLVSAQTPEEPYFHCVSSSQGCPADSGPAMTIISSYGVIGDNNPGQIAFVTITCTQPACPWPDTVYVTIRANVSWTTPVAPSTIDFHIEIPGDDVYMTANCPSGTSCDINQTVAVDGPSIYSAGDGWGIMKFYISGGANSTSEVWTIHELSATLINPSCDYSTVTTLADGLRILPAVELPLGPEGTPPDDQKITLPAGVSSTTIMKLVVYGGPWNDGTNTDRYDTAISFDGETWIPIADLDTLCVSTDPAHPALRTVYFYLPDGATEFYIRVNDVAEQFTDNTEVQPTYYDLATVVAGALLGCSSQFTIDYETSGYSVTVQGTDDVGQNAIYWTGVSDPESIDQPATNDQLQWYVLIIDPLTSPGWIESTTEGPTDPLQSLEMRYPTDPTDSWYALDDEPADQYHVWCKDDATGAIMYFFMPETAYGTYRVADLDYPKNFTDNTGSVTFIIRPVIQTSRPLSACESQFKLGDKIEENSVDATAPEGIRALRDWSGFPAPAPSDAGGMGEGRVTRPIGYLAVDTYGIPFTDLDYYPEGNHHLNYDADLAIQQFDLGNSTLTDLLYSFDLGLLDWYLQEQHPKVACAVQLDPYHIRTYLEMRGENDEALFIRAHEAGTDRSNNTGFLSYRIWEATEFNSRQAGDDVDEPGYCHSLFTVGDPITSLFIDARADSGVVIPTEPEQYYAVETTGGPWKDDGAGDDLYGVQVQFSDGWHTIKDASAQDVICAEHVSAESPYVRYYIRGSTGLQHRIRVDEPMPNTYSDFSTNTGSMGATIYAVNSTSDPWNNCADTYPDLSQIPALGDFTIAANDQVGLQIPSLVPGYNYAVAVTGGDWIDIPDSLLAQRDVQISKDNGVTWSPQDEFVTSCAQLRNDYLLFYFTYTAGDVWRMRVNENFTEGASSMSALQIADFIANSGSLTIRLYSTNQETTIPGQDGGMYCNDIGCTRPTSLLDIGGWIEYARCSIQRYLAWCPRHTLALLAVSGLGRHYEPWATMIGMVDIFDYIRDEFNAYVWTSNDPLDPLAYNDGQARGAVNDLIPASNRASPWNGGKVYFGDDGVFRNAMNNCGSAFATIIGRNGNAWKAACWTIGAFKIINIQWPFLNIMITTGAVIFFLTYIAKSWINQGQK